MGRFLNAAESWGANQATGTFPLDEDAYERLLYALLAVLAGANILTEFDPAAPQPVQIRHDALLWRRGTGELPEPDRIRGRWMRGTTPTQRRANAFFREFYDNPLPSLRAIEGREHTGQVPQEKREKREEQFREGELPVLFCSPTMELGIDISDLNVVHMRNVPPTPANYAQRSGRAGRSGQPALVMTYCATGNGHDRYFFERPLQMVAGAVAAPQIELANEDLVRAHIHAVWLAATGLDLSRSILNLLDTGAAGAPLRAEIATQIALPQATLDRCIEACERMTQARPADLEHARWFDIAWLQQALAHAAVAFDRAFDRWRQLYTAANMQFNRADQMIRRSHQQIVDPRATDDARRQRDEAERQIALLCNTQGSRRGDGDFYPYRYLASEGFLPGYNFPRLPVRAFLGTGNNEGTFLSRPRFQALTEFGPQNVIYHEGRKYIVTRTQLPAGGAQQALTRAKACNLCGYFHRDAEVDLCEQCGAKLDGGHVRMLPLLLEMTTALTRRVARITCEEEERLREGFTITTHYQFSRDQGGLRRFEAAPAGEPPLTLTYGPAATIWRVNHGWRRARQEGFALDPQNGNWGRKPDEIGDNGDGRGEEGMRQGIKLVVQDTRNLLIIAPSAAIAGDNEMITSLQYALQRGIEALFQLEEQELNSEILGEGLRRRILFWEAAEGGAGVLRRLVEEPDALLQVARSALEICHFDTALPEDHDCARACYRCLLSFTNQAFHAMINRHTIAALLRTLATLPVVQGGGRSGGTVVGGGLDAAALGPAAQRALAYIRANGGREPDALMPEKHGHRPHLFYAPSFYLLCPEPGEEITAMRDDIEDAGGTVVVLSAHDDIGAQLANKSFWRDSAKR